MLNEAQVQALTTQVLWAAFALALVFGAIAQRTHFCTMGALSDIVDDGRLVAHAHVGAGRGRGRARLQRDGGAGLGASRRHDLREPARRLCSATPRAA